MQAIFHQTIVVMSNAFHHLEQQVPAPRLVTFGGDHVFRFVEKTIEQALLLKAARVVTGLKALDALLTAGLLQEMAVICRVLDELGEDIAFLAIAITNDRETTLHKRYLHDFWEEEFPDPENKLVRHTKPDMPRRNKIQAYVQRVLNPTDNPSRISDVNQIISSTYSGYVHASAPQVLEMFGGDPPHFHIEGMRDTQMMNDHVHDAWNYFYRGITTYIIVARALGDAHLSRVLGEYHDKFLDQSGHRDKSEKVTPIAGREPPTRPPAI